MLRCLLLYLIVNYNFECLVSIKVPVGNPELRKNEPPDHIIPHTSHEHVPEPKYVPGNWLKPLKNRTKLDFTPQRLYSQVRRSSSVKKVPRKEALRRAQTDIEKEEAARLKESVSDKKINTFYTEEGFEDAAYDHAGHIRDADFKENYEQDQGKHRIKGLELKGESEDSDSEEEPRKNFYNSWQESGERTRTRDRFDDYDRNRGRYDKIIYPRKNSGGFGVSPRLIVENEIDLLEKDIKREEKEAEKGAETEVPENLRELKDSDYDEEEEVDRSSEDYHDDEDSFEYGGSSKFRIVAAEHPATAKTVDSYVGSIYTTELPKKSLEKQVLVVNAPKFDRREEKENVQNLERSEENYVYPTLAQIYETWKRRGVERMYESRGESAEDFDKKLNRVDEIKKPKKTYLVMVRPKMESNGTNLDPKKKSVFSTTESGLQENVKPVPSYRYQRKQKESRLGLNRDKLVAMTKMVPPSLTSRSEYAEYHNLRRNGSTQPQHDRPRMVKALSHQSALRFGGSRPRYFVTGREKGDNEKVSEGWKNNRFISRKFVILRKKRGVFSAPIVVDEVIDGELDKRFPEDGEDQSGEESLEINQEEEEEEEEKVEVEVPEFNFAEVVAQNNKSKNASNDKGDTDDGIDEEKYPFYNLMEHSTALKYVINPSFVPRKTLGGSEFYDSRDKYMSCEDVEPDLSEEVPEKEPGTTEKNLPRLKGLGDKLLCLKEKYFDEKPLDNPLFVEKQIESPTMPTEMDPEALRARFESLTEDYEDNSLRRMSGPVDLRSVESRIEESGDKQEGKWNNHAKKYRKRKRVSPTVSPYQREVYDDVMGTIKNLATMYKGVHVLSTRPPPKKKRQDSREKNDQVRINTSSRDVVVPLRGRTRHPKLGGYRTNRVSYRTRPMMKGFKGTDGKVVGFFKTVRVHKRDLRNIESNLEDVGIFDSRKIRNVSGVEGKNFSREDKNSRPRGAVRFGRFQDPGGQGRRNEPRYTAVRKFDEVYEVETKRQEPKKEVDRYDVHEDVQEAPEKVEEGKEIYRPAANENAENEDTGGTEDDEEEEEEEEYEASSGDEEEADENDGSEYVGDSGSKSESEEVSADAERNYEEMSEGEKEFERFSFRPFSSYESYYDPKYANLGPRVNKPAFHHPSFDSLESNKKDSEESEEYVFPWHEDEEDASEESRKHERFTGRHEYPWERRDRVRRERGKKYGPEWSPSESKTYFRKAYPWERYSVPWKYGGRRGHFWPDEDQGQGGGKHTYPKSRFKFKKLIGKGKKVDPSTTSTPQIPATEEMSKVEATTPLIFTTTTPIVYTIRPRIRRPVTQRTIESLKGDQAKAHSSPRAVKTVPEFRKSVNRGTIKANNSNLEVASDRRIRGSTTTRPSRKFLDNTTPSSRKVEHRSKVSKEEIITMSFPKMGSSESAEVKDNSSAGKIVQKVSILTKETPEHIYRTQEIDKNGVRDTIISVIPNNKTGSLKSMSIDRLDINSNDGNNNNNNGNNEQYTLDISLPLNKNLQLTEHGTRKVISSVSWIAENYDY